MGSRKRKTDPKSDPDEDNEPMYIVLPSESEEVQRELNMRRADPVPLPLLNDETALRRQIAYLDLENKRLAMANVQKDVELVEKVNELSELEGLNESRLRRIHEQERCIDGSRKENEKFLKDYERMKAENDDMREQLRSKGAEFAELRQQLSESLSSRSSLQIINSELKENMSRMVSQVRAEHSEMEKEKEEIEEKERSVCEREKTIREDEEKLRNTRNSTAKRFGGTGKSRIVRGYCSGKGRRVVKLPFSLLKRRQRINRLDKLHLAVQQACGPIGDPNENADETNKVLTKYMKKEKIVLKGHSKLTVSQDLEMSLEVNLSQNQRNRMKTFLGKRKSDVLAPTGPVKRMRDEIKEHYKYEYSEKEINTRDGKKIISLIVLTYIRETVKYRFENLIASGQLDGTKRSFDICISGDAGKASTKLVMIIGGVNSANDVRNLILLAKYDGEDSSFMIRSLLAEVIKEVNDLKEIELEIDGEMVTVSLVQFLTGDYKFLWAVLGMGTAMSIMNCIWCWRENRYKLSDSEPASALRTLNEMIERARAGTHSMSDVPLFDIPPERIIPGPLHTHSGVSIRFAISPLQILARNEDLAAAGLSIVDLNQISDFSDTVSGDAIVIPRGRGRKSENSANAIEKALKKLKEEQKELKKRKQNCDLESADGRLVVHLFYASGHREIDPAPNPFRCARGPNCLALHKKFSQLDRIRCATQVQCKICARRYHYACESRFSFYELAEMSTPEKEYNCLSCCAGEIVQLTKRIEEAQRKLEQIEKTKGEIDSEMEENQAKIDSLELIKEGKGNKTQELDHNLRLIGADLRSWGQCLTGNHIRKCLQDDAIEFLCSTISASASIDNHKKIMHLLKDIQRLSGSRPLTNLEKTVLLKSISDLERLVAVVYPNCNRFPKAHSLFAHVPTFVRTYGQWGLFTDQPTEKLHQFLNTKDRQYSNIRRKDQRWVAQAHDLAFANYIHDNKPPIRFDQYAPKKRGPYKKNNNANITTTNANTPSTSDT